MDRVGNAGEGSRGSVAERWHPAWVGLAGVLAYLPTLRYGLTRYDDPWLIGDNALLQRFEWSTIRTVLFDFSVERRLLLGAEYLPLRDLSVLLDFAVWGDAYGGHHLTQVLLYGAQCAVAAWLVLELFGSRPLSWWVGAGFALHPVHVEAVAWLSERKGVLGGVLFFSAALVGVRYLRRGAPWRLALALLLLAGAVLSKGHMLAGAGALVMSALWLGDVPPQRRWAIGVGSLVVGVLAFLPVYLAGQAVGMVQAYHGGGLLETAMLFTVVHGKYLLLTMLAGPYAIAYPLGADLDGAADPWLALLGGSALLVFAFFSVRALFRPAFRTPTSFGLSWWLVFLAPVSHVVFPLQNLLADRYLLVGIWGLLLVFGVGLVRLPVRPGRILGAAWLIASLAWTMLQVPHWESSRRLRTHAVAVHPGHIDSWHRLASEAQERGHFDEAERFVELGLAQAEGAEDRWRLHHRRALILKERGDIDEAIVWMRLAASGRRAHKAYANLAHLLAARGEWVEALAAARQATEYEPRSAHNQRTRGIMALRIGEVEEACLAFDEAVLLEPFNPDNHFNVGLCGLRSDDDAKRDSGFERAIALDPSLAPQVEQMLRSGPR
ncbi:MAG: tetratricopeptide repeat protein [Myxococcota bacterium]